MNKNMFNKNKKLLLENKIVPMLTSTNPIPHTLMISNAGQYMMDMGRVVYMDVIYSIISFLF